MIKEIKGLMMQVPLIMLDHRLQYFIVRCTGTIDVLLKYQRLNVDFKSLAIYKRANDVIRIRERENGERHFM